MEKIDLRFDCGFDFNEMTPSSRGAVCRTCSTEVVDFTSMNLEEIKSAFLAGNVKCGRFRDDHIGEIMDSRENFILKRKIAAAVVVLSLGFYQPSIAQSDSMYTFSLKKKPIEQVDSVKVDNQLKELDPEKPFFTKGRNRYYWSSRFPFIIRKRRRFQPVGTPSF